MIFRIFLVMCLLGLPPLLLAQGHVDSALSPYVKAAGISGTFNSVGSDTMKNLMENWAKSFQTYYPDIQIRVEAKGSVTAPPALIDGSAQIGPMSRKMKKEEYALVAEKGGSMPMAVAVALDAIAVYVNHNNPMPALSLQEVDAIFSKTLRGGYPRNLTTWGDVGLKGEWHSQPLHLYGRNSISGTYGFFQDRALFKGNYKDTVQEQPGSMSVVLKIAEDQSGIGYSGIAYKIPGVKALALAHKYGGTPYEPLYENVVNNTYPLSRALYIYMLKPPNKQLPKLVKEFLKFVLSREGQEIALKEDYLPFPSKVVNSQLELLE